MRLSKNKCYISCFMPTKVLGKAEVPKNIYIRGENMISLMWDLRNKTNEQNRNSLMNTERRLVVTMEEEDWGVSEGDKEIETYKINKLQGRKILHREYSQ